VRGERGGEVVVRGSGGVGGPILEEHVSGAGAQGLVRSFHELGGRDVRPRGGRGVQDQREVCEAFLYGQGEVREGVDRAVFS